MTTQRGDTTLTALGTDRPELSFVIPAHNEEGNILETLKRVSAKAQELVTTAEIIVVDDGSADETVAKVKSADVPTPVVLLRLSRNFGKEQAIMAGLERATGQAVVILDADLQEPLRYVDTMMEHYRDGYEMVYAVRENREDESFAKRNLTKAFYRMMSVGSKFTVPEDARDFRLMDRAVVEALLDLPERNRFMKGLYGWVGFRSIAIPVVLEKRKEGETKFGFRGLFSHAFTGLTSFTSWPLRVWTLIGGILALFSILYAVWITIRTLIWGADVPGWSTLTVAVFFLGGIQLISIGVLGEYLGRIFTEVKGRPGYIVAEEILAGDHEAAKDA
ncbi:MULTISPECIES: glycosyltransferase family 2 protein [Halocynthiibacter]|uniref:Glycosyltransferase family 2 protein n=1 Tax=Halocynthiibacter halioticoli TaxID=2986804 RepID=A0AAE3IZI5_9RHOB|nr:MULTISPECIES: glycosyltransferase family 2 protein [Halocynthiibacter]MCV6823985.1 glycosyltransferase family 2 protein [Halocynthiibacter halioticoli]MCW4056986.1 glycosyltransferase family 2 protein [Halocynthiibacter sp. SDUM655004]